LCSPGRLLRKNASPMEEANDPNHDLNRFVETVERIAKRRKGQIAHKDETFSG